jgi:hypothetical protein
MSFYDRCPACDEWHEPGPCYPNDEERVRDEGWRLYRAIRTQLFPKSEERNE